MNRVALTSNRKWFVLNFVAFLPISGSQYGQRGVARFDSTLRLAQGASGSHLTSPPGVKRWGVLWEGPINMVIRFICWIQI